MAAILYLHAATVDKNLSSPLENSNFFRSAGIPLPGAANHAAKPNRALPPDIMMRAPAAGAEDIAPARVPAQPSSAPVAGKPQLCPSSLAATVLSIARAATGPSKGAAVAEEDGRAVAAAGAGVAIATGTAAGGTRLLTA